MSFTKCQFMKGTCLMSVGGQIALTCCCNLKTTASVRRQRPRYVHRANEYTNMSLFLFCIASIFSIEYVPEQNMEKDMTDQFPPTRAALQEALVVAEELLKGCEMGSQPITGSLMMASRLARLMNDFDHLAIFQYELSGYPSTPDGVDSEVFRLAEKAGRKIEERDKEGNGREYVYLESVERLEAQVASGMKGIEAAKDPDVAISSQNPYQYVSQTTNKDERTTYRAAVLTSTNKLGTTRSLIYSYALSKYYELKFSDAIGDIFSRITGTVDSMIEQYVPDAVKKFVAIHDGLRSTNEEDWSNSVHSCRRILQELADSLFPPSDKPVERNGKKIALGKDQYINRIMCYVEDNSSSSRFKDVVGSHLKFLGERLDSVFKAAQKGSHASVSRNEADRYVAYTYMVIGDILTLRDDEG